MWQIGLKYSRVFILIGQILEDIAFILYLISAHSSD